MEKLVYSKQQNISYGVFKLSCGKLEKGNYKVTVEIIDGKEQQISYIKLSNDIYGTKTEQFKNCDKVLISKGGEKVNATIETNEDIYQYILMSVGQKKNTSLVEIKLYRIEGDEPTPPQPEPTPTPTPTSDYKFWVGTLNEYNSIKHNDKTIYFIKEG